jgi:hypothetical protein
MKHHQTATVGSTDSLLGIYHIESGGLNGIPEV